MDDGRSLAAALWLVGWVTVPPDPGVIPPAERRAWTAVVGDHGLRLAVRAYRPQRFRLSASNRSS